MPDPQIERIKTEVYFTDRSGLEWQVVDARRRRDGRLWKQYAGCDDAQLRYFVRYTPIDGANARRAVEVRRYDFRAGESRWFVADAWQLQLELADIRPPAEPAR